MTSRAAGAGRTLCKWTLAKLEFFYPLVRVWSVNRQIGSDSERRADSDEVDGLIEYGRCLDAPARAELITVFTDDVARLRRVEDKLSGQRATVALLLSIASVVGGAAVSEHSVTGLLLVGGSFIWLISAGFLTLEGSRARPLYLPNPLASVERGDRDVAGRLAGDRLQALSLNAARGWQLTNALFALQRSLAVAVVWLICCGLVTTAHQLAHTG